MWKKFTLSALALTLSLTALGTTAAQAADAQTNVTLTVQTEASSQPSSKPEPSSKPSNPGGGGGSSDRDNDRDDSSSERRNPTGKPAGGKDGNGKSYHLLPGIQVSKSVTEDGYIIGRPDYTFALDGELTRAEFATILDRVFTFDQEKTTNKFIDTKGHWAEKSISRLAAHKIILGVSSTEFRPDDTITRDQVLQMLSRIIKVSSYSSKSDIASLKDHYAEETLARILNSGIYDSLAKNYDVTKAITRGEMVHLVNNVIYARHPDVSKIEKTLEKEDLFTDLLQESESPYYESSLKSLDLSQLKLEGRD